MQLPELRASAVPARAIPVSPAAHRHPHQAGHAAVAPAVAPASARDAHAAAAQARAAAHAVSHRTGGVSEGSWDTGMTQLHHAAAAAAPRPAAKPAASAKHAATVTKIRTYLTSKHSPLAAHAETFVKAGEKYGVDPRLVVAISGAESGFGKHTFRPYNAWGYIGVHFSSWDNAIDTVAHGLGKNYVKQGLTSVAAVQKRYSPVGASNDPGNMNSGWRSTVTQFLHELGGNPNNVRFHG